MLGVLMALSVNAQRDQLVRDFHASYLNDAGLNAFYNVPNHLGPNPNDHTFIWGPDYTTSSYVRMAELIPILGRKRLYFNRAIAHFEHYLDRRDDVDPNRTAAERADVLGFVEPWWINNYYTWDDEPISFVGHDGQFTYPMVHFAYIILSSNNIALKNTVYTTPANRATTYSANGESTPVVSFHGMTYQQIAEELVDRVDETVEAHITHHWDQYVSSPSGHTYATFEYYPGIRVADYEGPDYTIYDYGPSEPYNLHASMGRTMLMMYLCNNELYGTSDQRTIDYLERTQWMGAYQRSELMIHNDGGYEWHYAPERNAILDPTQTKTTGPDDITHTFLSMEFLYLLNKYDIKNYDLPQVTIIDNNDMNKLAQAVNRMYASPRHYEEFVYDPPGGNPPIVSFANVGQFAPAHGNFAPWNNNLLHRGYDEIMTNVISGNPGRFPQFGAAVTYQGAVEAGMKMRPLAVDRGPGPASRWIGVSGGDFDGDGRDEEFITVRNFDGDFFLYKYDLSVGTVLIENMRVMADYTGFGDDSDWNDVAAGDFDGDNIDECVAVRNIDGNFYMLEYNGTDLVGVPGGSYTNFGEDSEWAGICAGNFDASTPEDEFAAVRNFDGKLEFFKYDGTILGLPGGSYNTNVTDWTDLTAGDFDNDGVDEIIGTTASGQMRLYYYDNGNINPNFGSFQIPVFGAADYYNVTAGDFDRDRVEDEIVTIDINGMVRVFELTQTISGGDEDWVVTQVHEEKMSADYFEYSGAIGSAALSKEKCSYDKLFIARNSQTDADVFIYDVGLDLDLSWYCEEKIPLACLNFSPSGNGDVDEVQVHNDERLESNTNWNNETHYVSGTLTIDDGVHLDLNNTEVVFAEGAKVIVSPKARFSLNGSELKGCEGVVWQGIEVRGQKNKNHNPAFQGNIKVHSSTVRDAEIAIYAGERDANGQSVADGAGGIVKISHQSKFVNNGVHVVLDDYGKANNQYVIKDSEFDQLYMYPESHNATAHIAVLGNEKITIEGNIFSGGKNGIVLNSSTDIKIEDNQFSYFTTGIRGVATTEVQVIGNDFTSGGTGISLLESKDFTISENTFTDVKIAVSTKDSKKDDASSTITDNAIYKAEIGLEFEDDDHSELLISCNDFNAYTKFGIKSTGTDLMDFGSVSEGCSNKFVSNSPELFDCIDHNGSDTKYYYNPADAASFSNPNVMSIDKQQAGSDQVCAAKSIAITNPVEPPIEVRIYPNPNNGQFMLRADTDLKNGVVEVYNNLGQLVVTQSLNQPRKQLIQIVDAAPGIYVVKVVFSASTSQHRVVIR